LSYAALNSVTVGPQTGTLTYGTAGSVTFLITLSNGTPAGDIELSVSGLGAGKSGSFASACVTVGASASGSTTLTVNSTVSASAGADGFTVTGNRHSTTNGTCGGASFADVNGSGTVTISQLPTTATYSGVSRQYNGNSSATFTCTLSGLINGDNPSCSGTASFPDADIGTGKTVTISGVTLSGSGSGNYSLSNNSGSSTADITQKSITPVFSAPTNSISKVYDGLTTATVVLGGSTTLTGGAGGFIGGDDVSLTFTDAYYGPVGSPNKHIDSPGTQPSDTVTVSGIALTGTDAGNYTLAATAASDTDAGSLSAKPITVTAVSCSKVYDGSTSAVTCNAPSTGFPTFTALAPGDLYFPVQAFSNKNIGTGKTIIPSGAVSDGNSGNNYSYNFTNDTTGEITAFALTPIITANDKTYDQTDVATGTCSPSGVFAPDVVTCAFSSLTFSDKNAGIGKTVTASGITIGGAGAANYSAPTSTTTTATINPKTIAADFTAPVDVIVKEYDGTDTVTTAATTLNGYMTLAPGSVFFGDEADAVVTSATYDTKLVGSSKGITANLSLSGADAGNYALATATDTDTNAGKIDQKALTISAVTDTKVFDNTGASTALPTAPLPVGETLIAIQEFFPDVTVGTGRTIRVQPLSWTITDSLSVDVTSQYTISTQDNTTGVILPVPAITIANPTTTPAQSKTITATTTDGTLEMVIFNGLLSCDATTIGFVPYASITFSSESDNGKYVCYRATNVLGDEEFALSDAIAGIDTTAPGITLATSASSPTSTTPIPFTATLTETPSGNVFDLSDITVTGGTAGNFSGSGTSYSFEVTPTTDNSTITVQVDASKFTDTAGNNSTASNALSINYDSSAPSISISTPATGLKTNQTTVNTTFTITNSAIAPIATVECAVDSGAFAACDSNSAHAFTALAEGTRTLKVKVTDTASNSATASVDVTIDLTAPVITVPADFTLEATGPTTTVTYSASITDAVGSTSMSCDIATGSTLTLGSHTITCTGSDTAGNSATPGVFHVLIEDTTDPVFSTPADVVGGSLTSPATMTFVNPIANDLVDGPLPSVCTPASGSAFVFGSTTVTCEVTDLSGNTASTSFNVIVNIIPSNGAISGSIGGGGSSSIIATVGGGGGGGGSYVPPTNSNPTNGTDQVSTGQQTVSQENGEVTAPSIANVTPQNGDGAVAGETTFKFNKNMSIGSRLSPDVTELQKILIAKGFLKITKPTGVYGPQTASAVKKYQKANAIAQTGTVGPATRAALNAGK
jgi:hypothetical protein